MKNESGVFCSVVAFSALLLMWFVFSGYLTVFFIVAALISTALAVFISHKMGVMDLKPFNLVLNISAPLYILWMFKEIFISSLKLAASLWTHGRYKPVMRWVDAGSDDVSQTCYAQAVTLTPGTVSVDMKDGKVLVHALSPELAKDLEG